MTAAYPHLIPELYVTDIRASTDFYCTLLGFSIAYQREPEKFTCIEREGIRIMLEEPVGRTWLLAPIERPFGRGINLQIPVKDIRQLIEQIERSGTSWVQPPETVSYRIAEGSLTQTQCVIKDPDGYLLRFAQVEA